MGQVLGKADVQPQALPFIGLPSRAVVELFDTFAIVAESYGITQSEAADIVQISLGEYLNSGIVASSNTKTKKEKIASLADDLFLLLDVNSRSLVDSFEFLSTLTLLSACTVEEKISFILQLYDFDDSQNLTVEEATLALKAAITGLQKVTRSDLLPSSDDKIIDRLVLAAFQVDTGVSVIDEDDDDDDDEVVLTSRCSSSVCKDDFISYVIASPEISLWIRYVDDFDEDNQTVISTHDQPDDVKSSRSLQLHLNPEMEEVEPIINNTCNQQPWRDMVRLSKPSNDDNSTPPSLIPNATLELDWIYGRNSHCIGSNTFYSAKGQVLYPAGAVVVKASVDINGSSSCRQQEYFTEHADYVTCLAVHDYCDHDDGNDDEMLVASAHVRDCSSVKVWSSVTMQSLVTLRTSYQEGVAQLAFAPSGKLLLAVGLDPMHSITVYQWRDRSTVFTSLSTSQAIMDCAFLGTDDRFGLCGDSFVHFWECSNSQQRCAGGGALGYQRQRGLFGNKLKQQAMTCIAHANGLVITGSITGNLCIWEGRCCVQTLPVGTCGSITCLHAITSRCLAANTDGGVDCHLCVATSDGRIHLWSIHSSHIDGDEKLELSLLASLTVASYGGLDQYIDSLCMSPCRKYLLVGLRSSELFEVEVADGNVVKTIMAGHGGGDAKLKGLAANPVDNNEIVTGGSDGTVRVWNIESHQTKRMAVLDTPAACVSYSSDGARIFVGFGFGCGPPGVKIGGSNKSDAKKVGGHLVLKSQDLSILKEARHSSKGLNDCKCSLDGKYYAFASEDCSIYIYDATTYCLLHKARGHGAAVGRIDFGHCLLEDSRKVFLQSTSANGEVMYWNAADGKKQTPSSQRNTVWDSHSCTLGLSVQCAHNDGCGELTACCRSNRESDSSLSSIVLADEEAGIRLCCQYSVKDECSSFSKTYRGHSKTIGNVCFSREDAWLLSVGAEDCCLFQWRHEIDSILQSIADDASTISIADKRIATPSISTCGTTAAVPLAPWRRTIFEPSNVPANAKKRSLPRSELELEWVHGYTASSSVDYTNDGELLYCVGRTLVKYNVKKQEQAFHQECTGEIDSLAMHPSRPLCAVSHNDGENPSIHVLDHRQMKTVQILTIDPKSSTGRPTSAAVVKFNKSGKYLVCICQDVYQSMLVIDWENDALVASSLTRQHATQETRDVSFLPDGSGLVQCGINMLQFWSWSGSRLNFSNADLGNNNKNQTFHAIGFLGNQPVVGTGDGYLYRFLGRTLDASIKAHASAILCISSTITGIATGSRDGVVKIWHQSLSCILAIDVPGGLGVINSSSSSSSSNSSSIICSADSAPNTPILNLKWDNEFERILVGTDANEVWEVSSRDGSNSHGCGGPIVQGHSGNHSIGLSVNPRMSSFITVGDNMIRVWDIHEGKQLRRCKAIEMASRACTHSPDGKYIAIGFGATRKQSAKELHGKVAILREKDLEVEFEMRDSRKMLTEIKWSSDGTLLAVGSCDTNVYLYQIEYIRNGYGPTSIARVEAALTHKIEHHNSYITNIDFSADCRYLQVNCGSYELAFYETRTGKSISGSSLLRDVIWGTQTCTLGWPVQGVWSSSSSACNRNDPRAEPTAVDCTLTPTLAGTEVVASGDSEGRINLFRYPCAASSPQAKTYGAHCGPVAKARWIGGDSHLITVGENDQAVMVWRHSVDDEASSKSSDELSSDAEQSEEDDCFCRRCRRSAIEAEAEGSSSSSSSSSEMARPWVRGMIELSNPECNKSTSGNELLENELHLAFIHGVQSKFMGAQVLYNAHNDIVYPTSRYGVLYDKTSHTQRLFARHEGEITAMCSSPGGRLVVSGDRSNTNTDQPTVRIWDAQTCQQICTLPRHHRRGIACVAFSPDAKLLVTVGADADNSVALWTSFTGEWHDTVLQATATGGVQRILFACFACRRASISSTTGSETVELVTGGKDHVNFWSRCGRNLMQTRGVFSPEEEPPAISCGTMVADGDCLVTGAESGDLYVWKEHKLEQTIKAHSQQLNCIQTVRDAVVTAGDDGRVIIWHIKQTGDDDDIPQLHMVSSFDIKNPVKSIAIDPTSFSMAGSIKKILVATRACDLYELSVQTGDWLHLHAGHSGGQSHHDELWGLATHPCNPDIYATCADDGTLRLWSLSLHKTIRKTKLPCASRALCWSSDGQTILVGCGKGDIVNGSDAIADGTFVLLDSTTLEVIHSRQDCTSWITEARFSPNDNMFALAAADKKIYIYHNDVPNKCRLKCVAHSHNASITSLDFSSRDGFYIQSGSEDHELIVHNTESGECMSLPSQPKSINWSSYTSTYGWPVQGLWPLLAECQQGSHDEPVSVDRSNDCKLLTVGTRAGHIQLFNYPVLSKDCANTRRTKHGHSGHAKCRFTCDGKNIITIGREDHGIIVWTLR